MRSGVADGTKTNPNLEQMQSLQYLSHAACRQRQLLLKFHCVSFPWRIIRKRTLNTNDRHRKRRMPPLSSVWMYRESWSSLPVGAPSFKRMLLRWCAEVFHAFLPFKKRAQTYTHICVGDEGWFRTCTEIRWRKSDQTILEALSEKAGYGLRAKI